MTFNFSLFDNDTKMIKQSTIKVAQKLLKCDDLIIFKAGGLNGNKLYLEPYVRFLPSKVFANKEGHNTYYSMQMFSRHTGNLIHLSNIGGHDFCYSYVPSGYSYVIILYMPRHLKLTITNLLRRFIQKHKKLEKETSPVDKPILNDDLYDEIIKYSLNYLDVLKKHEHLKLKANRGLIFSGSPGNGKTMLCRHLIDLAESKSYKVQNFSGAEINAAFLKGQLSNLFRSGHVIFFDDVDVGIFSRKTQPQLACDILSAMDGLYNSGGSIRIFTTNEEISNMDEAFLRPGRIDRVFLFTLPSSSLREKYILTWPPEATDGIHVKELIESTHGFSFAKMAEIKNELMLNNVLGHKTNLNELVKNFNSQTHKKVGF